MELPDFLNPEYFKATGNIGIVIGEAGIIAFCLSAWTSLVSFRASLQRQSAPLLWLGFLTLTYSLWNILYLFAASQRDVTFFDQTLPSERAEIFQLFLSLLIPFFSAQFLRTFLGRKNFQLSLLKPTVIATVGFFVTIYVIPPLDKRLIIAVGLFVFGYLFRILFSLWKLCKGTDDLKLKTRSFFIFLGLLVCSVMSVIGQMRADNMTSQIPLPYLGTLLSSIFMYFLYQMTLNPRLREVRELMLRGIRVILLTVILTTIFVSLLVWVGSSDFELFVFNSFIASFLILTILEPIRKKLDRLFVQYFIVDRYEFEELLRKIPRKIRKSRSLNDLCSEVINGIRESGRIYQSALYLYEPRSRSYRLMDPSNLTFVTTLEENDILIEEMKKTKSFILMESDIESQPEVIQCLKDRHTHILIPLIKGEELIGAWGLRSSLRSTNPYTSFSNEEILLLMDLSVEIVNGLDQIDHFESEERKERLAALGEMSAALAHEIRNPLGAIQGAIQLLATSTKIDDNDDKECLQILKKETDRLQKTVDQYLNFARKPADPSPVDLNKLTQAVVLELKAKASATRSEILVSSPTSLPQVMTDSLKVEQVLSNLVLNACEAFSPHVWIHLDIHHAEGQSWLMIKVKDDGPGISAENLETIFNPLFTTKKAGSGLGLPICKKMMDSLGGKLTVQSSLGTGTEFFVWLPLNEVDRASPLQNG